MLRVEKILLASEDDFQAIDTITLDETDRHRRRMALTSDTGIRAILDLPEARLLRHGEGLLLSDNTVLKVQAKAESLYEISADDQHHLLTLIWHVGNRHLATQITAEGFRIRADHVIKDMLLGLGAKVEELNAPFDPLSGAYDHAPKHHSHSEHK